MRKNNLVSRRGFTLIELLVVIFIIGILVALLLPAVNRARETGRRMRCLNNLKQMCVGANSHVSSHGFYPTGGWRGNWIGDPDRGFGRDQPGGWIFNILPYIDETGTYNTSLGLDIQKGSDAAQKKMKAGFMAQTPLSTFQCSTRRRIQTFRVEASVNFVNMDFFDPNSTPPAQVPQNQRRIARSDYAANTGPFSDEWNWNAPVLSSLASMEADRFPWPDTSWCKGVVCPTTVVRVASIRDGPNYTYLFGEKYVNPDHYADGKDPGDDQSMYGGFELDIQRFTSGYEHSVGLGSAELDDAKRADKKTVRFGSAHSAGWHAVFCDGQAKIMNFSIAPEVHASLGNRADGNILDDAEF